MHFYRETPDFAVSWLRYLLAMLRATNREVSEFNDNLLVAAHIALQAAKNNPLSLLETMEIAGHNVSMVRKESARGRRKNSPASPSTNSRKARRRSSTPSRTEGEKLSGFMRREAEVMEAVANFTEQIEKIKDEFGFHFNADTYKLVHETDSFLLYQVLPLKKDVKVRTDVKPMMLIPPYMLGVHILSFLPHENKSYAHSFANEGVPTYVRVVKDILTHEKVQAAPEETVTRRTSSARRSRN
ncbi:MAG: hypothetical protein U1E63_16335 [Burkholderiales bacterium]